MYGLDKNALQKGFSPMKAAVNAIKLFQKISGTGLRGHITAKFFTGLLKLIHPRRKVMNANMKIAYPESSEHWRKNMISKCYEHLGWTIEEILALQKDPSQVLDWVKKVHNDGLMNELLEQKKGMIFLTAHLGNWELMGSWYAQYTKLHGHEVHVVYQEMHDQDMTKYIVQTRENTGIKLLPKDLPVQKYVHMLKNGMHLALLDDVSGTGKMTVPFMGHDATNMPGPAVIALLSGVPVIPVFSYRVAPFQHEIELLDPVKLPDKKGGREDRIRLTVQAFNDALETCIRAKPEQWFGWLHRRWRSCYDYAAE